MHANFLDLGFPYGSQTVSLSHVTPLGCSITSRLFVATTCPTIAGCMDIVLKECELELVRSQTHPATWVDFCTELSNLKPLGRNYRNLNTTLAARLLRATLAGYSGEDPMISIYRDQTNFITNLTLLGSTKYKHPLSWILNEKVINPPRSEDPEIRLLASLTLSCSESAHPRLMENYFNGLLDIAQWVPSLTLRCEAERVSS